ncbi:hypothetical protein WA158_008356 [Blastocystis sp. Blastoise]
MFDLREHYNVDGKVALVTGSASGLGFKIAERLLKKGSSVILWDINEKLLVESYTKLSKFVKKGQHLSYQVVDLADINSIEKYVTEALEKHGTIDILVNNAGVMEAQSLQTISISESQHAFYVNYFSQLQLIRLLFPIMIQQKSGYIISISSLMADLPGSFLFNYCTTKTSISSLHACIRQELLPLGLYNDIHTLCVYPYILDTNMFKEAMNYTNSMIHNLCRDIWGRFIMTIFPRLSADCVADTILKSIERIDHIRYIPGYFRYLILLLRFFPCWFQDVVTSLMGGGHGMDSYMNNKHSDLSPDSISLEEKKNN